VCEYLSHLRTRITRQEHSLDAMTAMWLLPVVTLIVSSSSGGVLCRAIQVHSQLHALQTLAVSVFMVTVGLTLALMILTVYLLRLIIYGLPRGRTALSIFLPLGPTSQSGYAILLIGQNSKKILPFPCQSYEFLNSSSTGAIVEVVCICGSFLLWSLATMWILYALLGVYSGLRQSRIVFRVSFWGLVFPNVTTLACIIYYPFTKSYSSRVSMQTLQSNSGKYSIRRCSESSDPFMRYAHY